MRVMESSIDSLRSHAERAYAEARTDTLTGLPNERRYAEDVRMLQDRIGRVAGSTAALFVDLDRFGLINKAFGQERGDATLARVAGVLAAQCRTGDTVYRVGGEEFVVLMPGTDRSGGCVAAERIRAAVEAAAIPHRGRTGIQVVTVSIGVAAGAGPSVDVAEVVNRANGQMRRAKRAGRNRVSPRPDQYEGVA
jgi:diguanylate cyclase (GGDEF)-like protein